LLCLPHAGGGASAYSNWGTHFASNIAVFAVRYPGRETRWGEPIPDDLDTLVQSIADDLTSFWDKPFALFGHSFGALVATELARVLAGRGGPMPLRLFLSGARAPQLRPREPIHALPDVAFLRELREFNGMPAEILDNDELLQLAMPILRGDFRLLETHCFDKGLKLPVPVSVFGGLNDRTALPGDVVAWSSVTSKSFRARFFEGDHFFHVGNVAKLAQFIAEDLGASTEFSDA